MEDVPWLARGHALRDGTFFLHGSPSGTSLELAKRTMDWTHAHGVAPQTFFGTTDGGAQRLDPLPGHLGVAKGAKAAASPINADDPRIIGS